MKDHPDDLASRVALTAAIRQARIDAGLSHRAFARRLGVVQSSVPCFEGRHGHRVGAAQRYARGVDHRLTLTIHGLPAVADGTVTAYHQLSVTSTDPTLADAYHRAAVLETLRVIRLDSGQPARALGPAMGCGERMVLDIESGREDLRLSTMQRYTRALGGRLGWALTPIPAPAAVLL